MLVRNTLLLLLLAHCGGTPASGWRDGRALPEARLEGFATSLNGKIYYLGGITGVTGAMETAQPTARVDVYDIASDTWTRGPDLPAEAPKHHLAIAVHQNRLFLLGGFDGIIGRGRPDDAFRPIATTWVLDGTQWRRLRDAPIARGGATAQSIGNLIYVAGGTQNEGIDPYSALTAYDPATDQWQTLAPMNSAREHVASCVLNGLLYVVGGWAGASRTTHATLESYNPSTNRWTTLPPMNVGRGGLGAVTLRGRCHVIGGEDWSLPLPGTFATHEAFDPNTNQWSTLAPMNEARHGSGVTLANDEVWILGGGPLQGNSYTARVEIFRL